MILLRKLTALQIVKLTIDCFCQFEEQSTIIRKRTVEIDIGDDAYVSFDHRPCGAYMRWHAPEADDVARKRKLDYLVLAIGRSDVMANGAAFDAI